MAEVLVPIRSVKQYFNEFAVNGIGKGADKDLIRSQLIDTFQKEIFGQLMVKFGDPGMLAKDISEIDAETKQKIDNILSNSVRKWKRLCILFSQYRETHNVIFPSDLMVTLEDIVKAQLEDNDANLLENDDEEETEND